MTEPGGLEGWLFKRHAASKKLRALAEPNGQRRFFMVVPPYRLQYFKTDRKGNRETAGTIAINEITGVYQQIFDKVSKEYVNSGFSIETGSRTFDLLAQSPEDRERWITGLKQHVAYLEKLSPSQSSTGMTVDTKDEDDEDEDEDVEVLRSGSNDAGEGIAFDTAAPPQQEASIENEAFNVDRGRSRSSAVSAEGRAKRPTQRPVSALLRSNGGNSVPKRPTRRPVTMMDTESLAKTEDSSRDLPLPPTPKSIPGTTNTGATNVTETAHASGIDTEGAVEVESALTDASGRRPSLEKDADVQEGLESEENSVAVQVTEAGGDVDVVRRREKMPSLGVRNDETAATAEVPASEVQTSHLDSSEHRSITASSEVLHSTEAENAEARILHLNSSDVGPSARPRSQLLSPAADEVRPADESKDIVRVVFWDRREKCVLKVPLPRVAAPNIASVRLGIISAAGMDRATVDTFDFFEITRSGLDRKLGEDANPLTCKADKSEIVMVPPEKRPLVLFFQQDQEYDFVVIPVKWDVTAGELCDVHTKALSKDYKSRLRDITNPGLFLRKNFKDILFAPEEEPLDLLYEPALEDQDQRTRERKLMSTSTKLVMKSKDLSVGSTARSASLNKGGSQQASDDLRDGVLQGYLLKKGDDSIRAAWKQRWFVFQDGVLKYYHAKRDRDALNVIDASSFTGARLAQAHETEKGYDHHFVLETHLERGNFHLAAETAEEAERWVTELDAAIMIPTHSGRLSKKGKGNSAWKSRWFELRGLHLVYFVNQGDNRQKGTILLDGSAEVERSLDEETCFSVTISGSRGKGRRGGGAGAVYELRGESNTATEDWVDAIQKAIKGENLGEESNESSMSPMNEAFVVSSDGPDFADSVAVDAERPGQQLYGYDEEEAAHIRTLMDRSNSTVFTSRERFMVPKNRPKQLPPPLFDPSEANPASSPKFIYDDSKPNPYKDMDWSKSNSEAIEISPALQNVMEDADPLNSIGTSFSQPAPLVNMNSTPFDASRLENLGQRKEGDVEDPELELENDLDVVPDGLLAALESAPEPLIQQTINDVLQVWDPAMLQTFVLGESSDLGDGSIGSHHRINLGGVQLTKQPNQLWAVTGGTLMPAMTREERRAGGFETHALPGVDGDILAHFFLADEQWRVTHDEPRRDKPSQGKKHTDIDARRKDASASRDGPRVAAPGPHAADPLVAEWIRVGGMKPVLSTESTVEAILDIYNEPMERLTASQSGGNVQSADNEEIRRAIFKTRRLLLDDSRNDEIGIIVRRDLCGALADALRSGMRKTTLFSKTTLWSLVCASTPRPKAHHAPWQISAYRARLDLSQNPNMARDNDIKFRSFICAGLNHHFLRDWLLELYINESTINKFYGDFAFMQVCPEPIFERLLTALDLLMALPFRLFSSFELRRRSTIQRKPTTLKPKATSHADDNAMSRSIRSASVYVEEQHKESPVQKQHPPNANPKGGVYVDVSDVNIDEVNGGAPVLDDRAEYAEIGEAAVEEPLGEDEGPIAYALYDNLEPDEGELAFRQGEMLYIVEQIDENWLQCSLGDHVGQVPINYVEIVT